MRLEEARRYAEWRFGRLPRIDEWRFAATAGGRYRLPWGDADRVVWANTAELGIGRVVPVGAFESGRQREGCFDLVGNAAEWTATPADGELGAVGAAGVSGELRLRWSRLDHHPALAVWRGALPAWPSAWIVAADDARVRRLAAPGFGEPMLGVWNSASPQAAGAAGYLVMRPTERSTRLGIRVATDPRTLLERLAAVSGRLEPAEEAALLRFLRRDDLQALFRRAAREVDALDTDRPVARLVAAELGR